jgi:putative transposase
MPVKRTIPHNSGMFSITFTCYQWLSLIDKVNGYDIIYNWFDHLKSEGHSHLARECRSAGAGMRGRQ